ncbi:hypothetical protein Q8F57_003410 [Paraburkholderia terrae]|uniref:hypothetical protein n=1 Tax=Paraburkholderia terrae TaxID=311230 RepID=UPI00296AEFE8|nr:hypothetical protein [Paraburkholderia terrae]MDW3655426.1 hypothetical protein [Paraburkholderia terrae]
MKTIFVFDDSRVTDRLYHIIAIGESGEGVALIKFDDWTMPNRRYAMGIDDVSEPADAHTMKLVNQTRSDVLAAYNGVFGAGEWAAVWIDSPKTDPACLDALRASHAALDARIAARNAALAESVLSFLGAEPAVVPHPVH